MGKRLNSALGDAVGWRVVDVRALAVGGALLWRGIDVRALPVGGALL
jgi:hypothetical protein